MSTTIKLRTAAFGGFHRQDVVDYIEQSAKEHAETVNALRAELKEAQEQLAALQGADARAKELEAQCAKLNERVQGLIPMERELETLRAQNAEYQPQAEAYARLKDTVGNIELDARTRAAETINAAEAEAAAATEKANQEAAETRRQAEEAAAAVTEQANREAAETRRQAEEEAAATVQQARSLLEQVTTQYSVIGKGANQSLTDAISRLTELRTSLEGLDALAQQFGGNSNE